jgi:NTE family protein
VLHVGRIEHPLVAPTKPWEVAQVAFEITRRHHFEEELAGTPGDVEVHVLPAGSQARTLTVRYRTTTGATRRIDDAHRAASEYLDTHLEA